MLSSVLLVSVVLGGNRNVPHVMQTKSDHCGGSVLTILSTALTSFVLFVLDFFRDFFVVWLPVGVSPGANNVVAARRANERAVWSIHDVVVELLFMGSSVGYPKEAWLWDKKWLKFCL